MLIPAARPIWPARHSAGMSFVVDLAPQADPMRIGTIVAGGRPDPNALHRATRGLRGSAQMAREERFFRAVSAFENVTRSLAGGALDWSEDMTERARATIADLRAMLNEPDPDAAGERESSITERWHAGAVAARAAHVAR